MMDHLEDFDQNQHGSDAFNPQQVSRDELNEGQNSSVLMEDQLPADVDDEEDGESVYMIDNVVMRKIQIEGEEGQFLMDADGNIYDMQANFIG